MMVFKEISVFVIGGFIDICATQFCPDRVIKIAELSREYKLRDDFCWGYVSGIVVVIYIFGLFKLLRALYCYFTGK